MQGDLRDNQEQELGGFLIPPDRKVSALPDVFGSLGTVLWTFPPTCRKFQGSGVMRPWLSLFFPASFLLSSALLGQLPWSPGLLASVCFITACWQAVA